MHLSRIGSCNRQTLSASLQYQYGMGGQCLIVSEYWGWGGPTDNIKKKPNDTSAKHGKNYGTGKYGTE